MAKNIAVTGPESTGKSWLTSKLAQHFDGFFVHEFAREYLSMRNNQYTLQDVVHIAAQQEKAIKAGQLTAKQYLFADTELLVCYIWAQFVFGYVPETIAESLQQQHFDLYLLCYPDLPWEPDPLREHPNERMVLFELYEKMLTDLKWPFVIIKGTGNKRLQNALHAINSNFS